MSPSHAGLWALLIVLWFAASVVYRLTRGKPLFARPARGATFVERWASGRCGGGLVARLSTAKNCLQVQLTPGQLQLTPHFPLTLGFLAEIYGYDRTVPLKDIRSVELLGGKFASAIEIHYTAPSGDAQVMQLLLRRGTEFLAQVHAQRSPAAMAAAPSLVEERR